MIDLWLPPKPAIIRPHIEKASFLPGMFPAGAAAAKVTAYPTLANTATSNIPLFPSSTTHNCALPSGLSAGQMIVLILSMANAQTITGAPTGFTQLYTQNSASGAARRIYVYYKIATGSEGSTVSVTFSAATTSMLSYAWSFDHCHGDIAAGTAVNTTLSPQSPNPPSVTASWGSVKNLFIAILVANGTEVTRTPPTNYANYAEAVLTSFSIRQQTISWARRELIAASDDPGAWAIANSAGDGSTYPTLSQHNTIVLRGT